jgi:hypothetical protein
MRDTVCDWDSNLPVRELEAARHNSRRAELSICLGTSLRIRPANALPLMTTRRHRQLKERCGDVVIVNLQRTPMDSHARIRIFAEVDVVMRMLLQRLDMPPDDAETKTTPTTTSSTTTATTSTAQTAGILFAGSVVAEWSEAAWTKRGEPITLPPLPLSSSSSSSSGATVARSTVLFAEVEKCKRQRQADGSEEK